MTHTKLSCRYFNHFDPGLLLWYPGPRPGDISAVTLAEGIYKETWVEQLGEVDGLNVCPQRDTNGWTVLAENIFLKSNYHNCWEYRHTVIVIARPGTLREEVIDASPMHLQKPGCLISTYPQESCRNYKDSLVRLTFQPWADWFETFGKSWVSVRPDLARRMHWKPLLTEPLSWQTEAGQLAVRSFGWQDGTPDGDRSSEIAYGWRVVVSPEAWEALLIDLQGQPWRVVEIQRGLGGEYAPASSWRWCAAVV